MRRCLVLITSAVLATAGLSSVAATTASAAATAPEVSEAPLRPQVARGIIVKAKTTSRARRTSIARTATAELPGDTAIATTSGGPAGLSLLAFDQTVEADDLDATLEAVRDRPDVEWAVPNGVRYALAASPVTPNDPGFAQQLNLWDTRTTGGLDNATLPVGGYSTKAPALWPATKGAGAVVAVVDTGITAHEDLAGRTVPGYDFVDQDCAWAEDGNCHYTGTYVSAGDGDGWDADPTDPGDWTTKDIDTACNGEPDPDVPADHFQASSWHGTHVAGIIAAAQGNGKGISGIAPETMIQPVRVLGHCGGGDWDIAMGVLWAAGYDVSDEIDDVPVNPMPADVINLSLGGQVDSLAVANQVCAFYGDVAALANAKGATVVAATGNSSASKIFDHRLSIPSACPGFVSVASTSDTGHRAWYSTAGAGVDVSAQGGDLNVEGAGHGILSTVNAGATTATAATNTYAEYHGTSMAAPAVSAAAAMLNSLGVTNPATIEMVIEGTSKAFPAASAAYNSRTFTLASSGRTITTANLNCTTALCGAGILDVSAFGTVPVPLSVLRLTGSAAVGRTLTAVPGTWRPAGTAPRITWYRGAAAVRTGTTYRVTAADLGQRITARATAPDGSRPSINSTAAVNVAKARSAATLSMPAKVKKTKRAKLKVRVSAPYTYATGTVRVYDGKRKLATKTLKAGHKGRLTITLPKLKKGTHKIKVVYSGSTQFTAATSKVKKVTSR